MRFAYVISEIQNGISTITLMNSGEVSDAGPKLAKLSLSWARASASTPWSFLGVTLLDITSDHARLLRNIKSAITDATRASPLKLVMELAQEGARQVIFDERMKKYRNVTTMKEGEDTYAAVGVKNMVVTAENEEQAITRVKKQVTNLMMEKPEAAAELAGWFSAGCKVSKLASGKLPDVVGREALAGPGEKELATKPVVIRPKKKKVKTESSKKG